MQKGKFRSKSKLSKGPLELILFYGKSLAAKGFCEEKELKCVLEKILRC